MITFFYLHGSTGSFLVDFRQNKYCWLQKYCIAITITGAAFLTGALSLIGQIFLFFNWLRAPSSQHQLKNLPRRLGSMFVLFYWLWFCGGFKLPFVWHRDEKQHWKKIVCITRWRRRAYTFRYIWHDTGALPEKLSMKIFDITVQIRIKSCAQNEQEFFSAFQKNFVFLKLTIGMHCSVVRRRSKKNFSCYIFNQILNKNIRISSKYN